MVPVRRGDVRMHHQELRLGPAQQAYRRLEHLRRLPVSIFISLPGL
jgi:hypothetical protein